MAGASGLSDWVKSSIVHYTKKISMWRDNIWLRFTKTSFTTFIKRGDIYILCCCIVVFSFVLSIFATLSIYYFMTREKKPSCLFMQLGYDIVILQYI